MKKNIALVAFLLLTSGFVMAQQNDGNRPHKPPTVEERLKRITAELNKYPDLTTAQKETIEAAYKTFFADMDKNISKDFTPPPPPPPPVKKEVADKLSAERDAKIKEVLTPEQYAKYLEVERTMRPKRPCGDEPPHEK